MNEHGLPFNVVEFVHKSIPSLAHLEILLLLRTEPTRTWTAEQVNAELRTSIHSAQMGLKDLYAQALLVTENGAYRYAPMDFSMGAAVSELAGLYATHRVRVIESVFSRPSHAIRDFAEAFKLKKGDRNG